MPHPSSAYFAHPISSYCSPEEDQALRTLNCAGFATVVNPSERVHQESCGRDMSRWAALAASCEGVAFMPFADGAVGAGVVQEVEAVLAQGKPVFHLTPDGGKLTAVTDWPAGLVLLDVPQTKERIGVFRAEREAQGLTTTPMREPAGVRGMKP